MANLRLDHNDFDGSEWSLGILGGIYRRKSVKNSGGGLTDLGGG